MGQAMEVMRRTKIINEAINTTDGYEFQNIVNRNKKFSARRNILLGAI
jgi:hypothetical protein